MASASHDIQLRRSTLVFLNVPFWQISEESLIEWIARIELTEEFQAGINRINSVDIVDFIFSERRIESTAHRTSAGHITCAVTCCR